MVTEGKHLISVSTLFVSNRILPDAYHGGTLRPPPPVPVLLVCFLIVGVPGRLEAQQEGETLFAEGRQLSETYIYHDFDDGREHTVRTTFQYGLERDYTLTVQVPYRDFRHTPDSGSFGDSGLGDSTLFGRYRVYEKDVYKGGLDVSLGAGLELPTGDTNEDGVPRHEQLGSGSWDPKLGAAVTYEPGRWRFDGIALYKYSTQGSGGFQEGETIQIEADAGYRFYLPDDYRKGSAKVNAGLRWTHKGSAEVNGSTIGGTGGDTIFARIGLSTHPTPETDLSLSYERPVHHSGDDRDNESFLSLTAGFRF